LALIDALRVIQGQRDVRNYRLDTVSKNQAEDIDA
jgi:hypothetical protein